MIETIDNARLNGNAVEPDHAGEILGQMKAKTEANDEGSFGVFTVNRPQSLVVGVDRANWMKAVSNELAAQAVENLAGNPESHGDDEGSSPAESKALSSMRNLNIVPAADTTFAKSEVFRRLFKESFASANRFIRSSDDPREEVRRITSRLGNETVIDEAVAEICDGLGTDFASSTIHVRRGSLEFVHEQIGDLIDALDRRQSAFVDQQRGLRAEAVSASGGPQNEERFSPPRPTFGSRARNLVRRVPFFGGFVSADNLASTLDVDSGIDAGFTDPVESALAQTDFQLAAVRAEISFFNRLQLWLESQIEELSASLDQAEISVTHFRQDRKMVETKRSLGLAAGELFLNGLRLTEATIHLLAGGSPGGQKAFRAELLRTVKAGLIRSDADLQELDFEKIRSIVMAAISERMGKLTVTDAIVALLDSPGMFENELHEAIRLTASTDFFAAGWEQLLRPSLDYFAAFSLPRSEVDSANGRLMQTLEGITASLNVNAAIKFELHENEDFCFYIEFFAVPIQSFEFFQRHITGFERIKDEPAYSPHREIYE